MEKDDFPERHSDRRRTIPRHFAPDPFALGLLALGVGLLLFSGMRTVAILAIVGAVAYWLMMQGSRLFSR